MVASASSYEVHCSCGQTLHGVRQARHQLLACSGCGGPVFVLPCSPFEMRADPSPLSISPWRRWRGPLIAACVCLFVVLVAFHLAWPYLMNEEKRLKGRTAATRGRDPSTVLEEATTALRQGRFRVARSLFDEAIRLRVTGREVMQLTRQAELLAQLSTRSLEEIVRQAMLVRDPNEWEKQFDDYRGRSVLFDDGVRRSERGEPVLAHHVVKVGDVTVRIVLTDLAMLRDLPLDDGPRLIFGARLASCNREEGGDWVIRFLPESGVLMTDLATVEACYPTPLDNDVRATVDRQARWLDERAGNPTIIPQER